MKKKIIHLVILFLLCYTQLRSQLGDSSTTTSQVVKLEQEAYKAEKECLKVSISNSNSSIEVCSDALQKSYKAGIDSLSVLNLVSLASYVYFNDSPEASYKYANEAKQIAEKPGNKYLKVRAYYTYALTWERFINLDNAVKYLNEALSIAIEVGDSEMEAKLISGVGYLFTVEELYEDSKVYFTEALTVAKRKDSKKTIALMQLYLGVAYRELGDLVKSEEYYKKASLYYSKEREDPGQERMILVYGLAKLESEKGNYQKSLDLLAKENGGYSIKASMSKFNMLLIAENYFNLKNYKVALQYYHELESKLLKTDESKIKKNLFKQIGDCYLSVGNNKLAIKYFKRHAAEMELQNKDKLDKSIATSELKYKLQREESENKFLTSEKERLILEAKSKNLSLAIFLISFLFLSFISFYVYKRQKAKTTFLKEVTIEKDKINADLLSQSKTKDVANEALITKNKELSHFAGVVAHDIKAPIRTTSSFIELIKKRIDVTNDDDRIKEYFAFIEKSNKNLSSLIDDLLQFTTSENNTLSNDDLDLNEVVDTVKDNLAHQILEKSATVSFENLPVIRANRSDMIRLFQNIIANAIKFTKDRDPIIEISSDINLHYYIIKIKDNGIGMKTEYLDKIFKPLARLHSASEYEGSGLGLASCKNIVEKLNGKLRVQSRLNVGSTFEIELPIDIIIANSNIDKSKIDIYDVV